MFTCSFMSTNFKREGVKEHTLTPTMSRFCTCSSFRPLAGFFLRLAFIACIFIWSNTGGSQMRGRGMGDWRGREQKVARICKFISCCWFSDVSSPWSPTRSCFLSWTFPRSWTWPMLAWKKTTRTNRLQVWHFNELILIKHSQHKARRNTNKNITWVAWCTPV